MTRVREILVATANEGKIREIEKIVEEMGGVRLLSLKNFPGLTPPEETGESFEENARIKALYYSSRAGVPAVAEDSGLVVDALDGAPGIYSSRFAGPQASDDENIDKLLEELSGKTRPWKARFVCVAVCADGGEIVATAEGILEGEIIPERRGTGGFGYDPVFFLPDEGRAAAELTLEEKNRISHRRKAFETLFRLLREKRFLG
ncbi:MAG: RdgB/HAM1 family non-canonical purine NTP pyrophosphatase [Deltaproteobacteria bacterium]|nr:MAG: RdgB/HAM1 family non-canonical purine NTP pyrophosphatase [Deltaproteobacteria bacterium]